MNHNITHNVSFAEHKQSLLSAIKYAKEEAKSFLDVCSSSEDKDWAENVINSLHKATK